MGLLIAIRYALQRRQVFAFCGLFFTRINPVLS